MLLPIIMPITAVEAACHNAPMMKRISAIKITFLRPNLSANTPAAGLANKAHRLVQDVMRLLSRVVKGCERSSPIDTRVDDITPVL